MIETENLSHGIQAENALLIFGEEDGGISRLQLVDMENEDEKDEEGKEKSNNEKEISREWQNRATRVRIV